MRASQNGHLDVVNFLLGRRVAINLTGGGNDTALIKAVKSGRVDVARRLIQAGARLDIRNSNGWTALDCAQRWKPRNKEIIDLLKDAGAA
jgi:ankyrin repeat protein